MYLYVAALFATGVGFALAGVPEVAIPLFAYATLGALIVLAISLGRAKVESPYSEHHGPAPRAPQPTRRARS
jgi:hypothetical protein